ncbi:MAG: hypothetical protein RSB97_08030, partial [Christensenella sp.]
IQNTPSNQDLQSEMSTATSQDESFTAPISSFEVGADATHAPSLNSKTGDASKLNMRSPSASTKSDLPITLPPIIIISQKGGDVNDKIKMARGYAGVYLTLQMTAGTSKWK